MMVCVQGFTKQEDCTMCMVCANGGYNECVKGFTTQEECDNCGVCTSQ